MNKKSVSEPEELDEERYQTELYKLQVELCKLQEWVKHTGTRVIVIFEGRDGAGKGGDDPGHHGAGKPSRIPGGGVEYPQ